MFGPASPCTKPESGVTLEASAGGQGSGQPRRDHPGQLQLEADPDVQTGPETTHDTRSLERNKFRILADIVQAGLVLS